ncbi:hypothetical protein ACI7BZ_20925 [Xanthobacter sp. AM11]|uniref:hypothetical protein n=1 Tax=Xanthobacter sp. AM11 TaxID=3380643 RepID=UPI0039BF9902
MSADLSLTGRKPPREASPLAWAAGTIAAIAIWFVVYAQLAPFSQWLVARLPVEPGSHLADAVTFFIYDTSSNLGIELLPDPGEGFLTIDSGAAAHAGIPRPPQLFDGLGTQRPPVLPVAQGLPHDLARRRILAGLDHLTHHRRHFGVRATLTFSTLAMRSFSFCPMVGKLTTNSKRSVFGSREQPGFISSKEAAHRHDGV